MDHCCFIMLSRGEWTMKCMSNKEEVRIIANANFPRTSTRDLLTSESKHSHLHPRLVLQLIASTSSRLQALIVIRRLSPASQPREQSRYHSCSLEVCEHGDGERRRRRPPCPPRPFDRKTDRNLLCLAWAWCTPTSSGVERPIAGSSTSSLSQFSGSEPTCSQMSIASWRLAEAMFVLTI